MLQTIKFSDGQTVQMEIKDKPKGKGSKYIQEVNELIKGYLMEARLGDGIPPWQKEWITIPKRNYDSGRLYQGLNRWLLSLDAEISYITLESIQKRGLKKPDASPRVVINYIPPKLRKAEESLPEVEKKAILKKRFPFMITHLVYRAKDIEGLPEKAYEGIKDNKRYENIESFIDAQKAKGLVVEEGGNSAHHVRHTEKISMPKIGQFESSEKYYRVFFHEMGHWTGTHLKRDDKKFDRTEYGKEELIAEMISAYVSHYFNIPMEENDFAYIDGWMKAIDADPYLLSSACAQAEKALKFLGLSE
jgi:antirestriction protein ArdC